MKREYTEPKAEKIDFNYQDKVVASVGGQGGLHEGANINGCYQGANANKSGCTPWYGTGGPNN